MVVDVAPQTELGTYTGLYYFFSTAAAVIGPILAGYLIEAMGGDYGMIFVLAPITLVFAFAFMFVVRRGERADHAGATVSAK
jgi:MFS family permease